MPCLEALTLRQSGAMSKIPIRLGRAMAAVGRADGAPNAHVTQSAQDRHARPDQAAHWFGVRACLRCTSQPADASAASRVRARRWSFTRRSLTASSGCPVQRRSPECRSPGEQKPGEVDRAIRARLLGTTRSSQGRPDRAPDRSRLAPTEQQAGPRRVSLTLRNATSHADPQSRSRPGSAPRRSRAPGWRRTACGHRSAPRTARAWPGGA
jgi:hypothetical protein